MAENDRSSMDAAALLVIDVQDSFMAGPRWQQRSTPDLESKLTTLVDAFRRAERPVFYFLHSDGDEHFSRSSPLYRLMGFLSPRPDEPVIHKTTRNALTSTNLLPMLLQRGIRRVVITGIQTEQCCETTARVAADLGFDVDFVTEATMTFPISEFTDGTGRQLSTAQIVERTEFALRHRFARIASVAEIVADLGVASPA